MSSIAQSRVPVLLSGFADEADLGPEQFTFAKKELGLNRVDPRFFQFPGDASKANLITFSDERIAAIVGMLSAAQLSVGVIGTPIGKAVATFQGHDNGDPENFKAGADQAIAGIARVYQALGQTPPVRIFAGKLSHQIEFDSIASQVLDETGYIAEKVKALGGRTLVENEGYTGAFQPAHTQFICEKLARENVGAIFDEGNALAVGMTHNEILKQLVTLLPYIEAIHLKCLDPKDPKLVQGKWTPETELTQFRVVQAAVYEFLFRELQETGEAQLSVANIETGVGFSADRPVIISAEPHRSISGRFGGSTDKPLFVEFMQELRKLGDGFNLEFK